MNVEPSSSANLPALAPYFNEPHLTRKEEDNPIEIARDILLLGIDFDKCLAGSEASQPIIAQAKKRLPEQKPKKSKTEFYADAIRSKFKSLEGMTLTPTQQIEIKRLEDNFYNTLDSIRIQVQKYLAQQAFKKTIKDL